MCSGSAEWLQLGTVGFVLHLLFHPLEAPERLPTSLKRKKIYCAIWSCALIWCNYVWRVTSHHCCNWPCWVESHSSRTQDAHSHQKRPAKASRKSCSIVLEWWSLRVSTEYMSAPVETCGYNITNQAATGSLTYEVNSWWRPHSGHEKYPLFPTAKVVLQAGFSVGFPCRTFEGPCLERKMEAVRLVRIPTKGSINVDALRSIAEMLVLTWHTFLHEGTWPAWRLRIARIYPV